ncbi:multidrug transporter [Xenophilus sp. AP218F]|nr:MATE family efflux transporter [Chromobacterium sp. ASV5]OWY38950.1 multidrug transporter [Xenophilus sp. AP218F]
MLEHRLTTSAPLARGSLWPAILALAWPMMLSAVLAGVLQNGQVWVLGRDGSDSRALYLLSMLQPYFLLFIAFMEGLAVTNQVFSARSARQWPRRRVWHSTLWLILAGAAATAILAPAASLLARHAPTMAGADMREVWRALPWYLGSLLPLLCFEIVNAGLRGQGRTLPGLALSLSAACLNLACCYALFAYGGLGFEAIVAANALSYGVFCLPLAWILRRAVRDGEAGPAAAFRARLLAILLDAGLPVFLTIVVAFASSAVVFPALAGLSGDNSVAFLLVIKLRMLFVIPAVALGSAVAILANQRLEGDPEGRGGLLREGLLLVACVYLALTALAWWQQHALIDLLSRSAGVRAAGYQLMQWLLPTFFLTALSTMLQTLLEQLGRGKQVLLATLALELGLAAAILLAIAQARALDWVLGCMLVCALLYAAVFLREFFRLARTPSEARHDA